jgi:hypothetical protein
MGASGWEYVIPYQGDVEQALAALHAEVFEQDFGEDPEYANLEDLWADEEMMGEEGAHSILDIQRVVTTTEVPVPGRPEDYGTLRPMASDRVVHHFGTERPKVSQFVALLEKAYRELTVPPGRSPSLPDECPMRWTGVHVVLRTDGQPTHLGIVGHSGD